VKLSDEAVVVVGRYGVEVSIKFSSCLFDGNNFKLVVEANIGNVLGSIQSHS